MWYHNTPYKSSRGHRALFAMIFAAALVTALLAMTRVSRGDDIGTDLAPAGQSIKKAAEDTGTAIKKSAQDVGSTVEQKTEPVIVKVKEGTQTAGAKVEEGAKATGNFFERTGKQIHDGAQSFFTKVGSFFSGQ